MSTKIASLFAEIKADTKGLDKGLKDTKTGLQKAEKGMASLAGSAATMTGVIVGVGVAAKKAFDFGQEGANLQRLENSFAELEGAVSSSGDGILSSLQKASQGTVANSDIILASNRAMMLGLGNDADKLASLMEVAAFRGRAMGLDTTTAFNDIVTGVGRASPLILDNLGIVVDSVKIYKEYADVLGVSASELTKAQKTQALLNAVVEEGNAMMGKAGGLVKDSAAEYEIFTANIKNETNALKKNVSNGLTPLIAWMNKRAAMSERLLELQDEGVSSIEAERIATKEFADEQENLAEIQAGELTASYIAAGEASMSYMTGVIDTTPQLVSAFGGLLDITKESGRAIESYREKQFQLVVQHEELTEKLAEATWQYGAQSEEVKELEHDIALLGLQEAENTRLFEESTNIRILKRAEEILSADGLTIAEEQALLAKGLAMGIYTQEFVAQAQTVIEQSQSIADQIAAIPEEKKITFITEIIQPLVRLTSGGRAAGGPVTGGDPIMVGETGPEIFTPNASGDITTNSELRSGGGDNFRTDALLKELFDNILTEDGMARVMSDVMATVTQ